MSKDKQFEFLQKISKKASDCGHYLCQGDEKTCLLVLGSLIQSLQDELLRFRDLEKSLD